MEGRKIELHPIKEWEKAVKHNPHELELLECRLVDGLVIMFKGFVIEDGKKRYLMWRGEGKCYYYNGQRAEQYDIHFNSKN